MTTTPPTQPAWPASQTFWRDKRVIVTGGSGFLGSFVVDKLHARGAQKDVRKRLGKRRQWGGDASGCADYMWEHLKLPLTATD